MFGPTDIVAFFMRLALFCFLFCCFPLVNNFFRSIVFQIYPPFSKLFRRVTASLLLVPLSVTIFFPAVGSILGIIGSVAGLFIVYILPTVTYLKLVYTECKTPLLAKALKSNEFEIKKGA